LSAEAFIREKGGKKKGEVESRVMKKERKRKEKEFW